MRAVKDEIRGVLDAEKAAAEAYRERLSGKKPTNTHQQVSEAEPKADDYLIFSPEAFV